MSTLTLIVSILILIKHFAADFPLQSVYMLGKARPGLAYVLPLSAHCAVHAGLSALIILAVRPEMIWLVALEFVAHFIIDRAKCLYRPWPTGTWAPEVRGQYLAQYYTAFGLDQLAHGLCYMIMLYLLAL